MSSIWANLGPYLEPILVACVIFPFVAGLFTLPFLIVNYRKYGGIALMRVLVVYSFILYSMCAFLLTVLPLPSREAVAQMPKPSIGWIPFKDFFVGLKKAGFSGLQSVIRPDLWRKFLTSSDLFQILANIVMQVPLGFYLRYYFRCTKRKTLVIGLLVSLFYELTQFSGLFFIYPHAYRFSTIDDLMNNTLGTMLGYLITPLLTLLLPSRDEIDRVSYDKGEKLTIVRRFVAAQLDLFFFTGMVVLFGWSVHLIGKNENNILRYGFPICAIVYYVLIPWITAGRLPGHAFLRLKVVQRDGERRPNPGQLLIRYAMLYVVEPLAVYLTLFAMLGAVLFAMVDGLSSIFTIVCFALCTLFVIVLAVIFIKTLHKHNCSPHSYLSGTTVVQTRRKMEEKKE